MDAHLKQKYACETLMRKQDCFGMVSCSCFKYIQ